MRLLIATGASLSDESDVPIGIATLVEAASEILVMSPSLPGRLDFLTNDTARARQVADERLADVLGKLGGAGVAAAGTLGDEAPLTAFADAIRQFEPDHIVIALRGADHRGWQEKNLIDRLLGRFRLPMTVFTVDATGRVDQ
jgi:hypothetical protein